MKAPKLSPHQIDAPILVQQTTSHCGPAVMQMLLAFLRFDVTQDDVVTAAKIQKKIKSDGMRPDMMVTALKKLSPKYKLWFKHHATMRDINTLIHKHHYPVGVGWQGLFYDTVREERKFNPNGDHGHYSVIVDLNRLRTKITMLDPFPDYAAKPRVFSYRWFLKRWWDFDTQIDKVTKKKKKIESRRLLFIVTPKDETFPEEMGLLPGSELFKFFKLK